MLWHGMLTRSCAQGQQVIRHWFGKQSACMGCVNAHVCIRSCLPDAAWLMTVHACFSLHCQQPYSAFAGGSVPEEACWGWCMLGCRTEVCLMCSCCGTSRSRTSPTST